MNNYQVPTDNNSKYIITNNQMHSSNSIACTITSTSAYIIIYTKTAENPSPRPKSFAQTPNINHYQS